MTSDSNERSLLRSDYFIAYFSEATVTMAALMPFVAPLLPNIFIMVTSATHSSSLLEQLPHYS